MNKKVELALQMDEQFQDWIAEFYPTEAQEFFEKCTIYNEMTRHGLNKFCRKIIEAAPRTNYGNKEQIALTFKIGNECSRVVYAHFSKIGTDLVDTQHTGAPLKTHDLIAKCQVIGKNALADEISVERNDGMKLVVRFWWD